MKRAGKAMRTSWGDLFQTYRRFLPAIDESALLDLGQGATPLIPSRWIGPQHGLERLYFKLESLNPTGSYKDRFASLAVSLARARGAKGCIATSSGNTGAALSAFTSAVGMRCAIFVNERTPIGKLRQMAAYGAQVYQVAQFGISLAESTSTMDALRKIAKSDDLDLFISAYSECPAGMEGIKTIAYELHRQMPGVNDVFAPVGGGGLFVAIARGYADLATEGNRTPRLHIVQPRLNDTAATRLNAGQSEAQAVKTTTAISGLAVPDVLDATTALDHARRSGGSGFVIEDEDAFAVQRLMVEREGLLVEPAAAVSVAGAIKAAQSGKLGPDRTVVAIVTGHGFKDPASIDAIAAETPVKAIGRAGIPDAVRAMDMPHPTRRDGPARQ
jgi:threonine synthase